MRSPEKCGYSVGKLCPTAKLCIRAVLGPKSLYSGLEIFSLPPLELNEANIIHDTRTTYPAMTNQSAMPEPLGRGTYVSAVSELLAASGASLTILCFHLGQVSSASTARKNNRLAHKSGLAVPANASPAK